MAKKSKMKIPQKISGHEISRRYKKLSDDFKKLIKRERDALIQFYFRIFSYIRNVEEQLFLSSFSKIEGGKERITERIMGPLMKLRHDEELCKDIRKVWDKYIKDMEEDDKEKKKYKKKINDRFEIMDL